MQCDHSLERCLMWDVYKTWSMNNPCRLGLCLVDVRLYLTPYKSSNDNEEN